MGVAKFEPAAGRVFKTTWFNKVAKKVRITDAALCLAIQQVLQGQADDLGNGVFKKRLNGNRHRSIVLAKGGRHWVFEYLFAKKDRDNIDEDELAGFRELAKAYANLSGAQLAQLLKNQDLVEICHDDQNQVQK